MNQAPTTPSNANGEPSLGIRKEKWFTICRFINYVAKNGDPVKIGERTLRYKLGGGIFLDDVPVTPVEALLFYHQQKSDLFTQEELVSPGQLSAIAHFVLVPLLSRSKTQEAPQT